MAPKIDLTVSPATDPLSLYKYRDGLYAVDLLSAAVGKLDFFTWLGNHPDSTEAEIREAFGFHERPLDVMLTLFRTQGYVATDGNGRTSITAMGYEHLSAESEWNLRPYFASLHDRPIARDFLQVLTTGKPAGWSGDKSAGDWHKSMEDEAFARSFTGAMDCRGRLLSAALTAVAAVRPDARLLDIGGGSGIYACAFAARHPGITASVLEQSPVDRICGKLIEERGLADRVTVTVGDMFKGIPTGYDLHLFSNVLHDWDTAEALDLLRLSHAALPVGGQVMIHDAFINADKTGPLHVAEYSTLLMHSTQGKCYSTAEYAEMLRTTGFEPGAYHDTAVGRGYMLADKV